MTREQIIEITRRELNLLPSSGPHKEANDDAMHTPIIIAALQLALPDTEIKTCQDFKHLNVPCCPLCHTYVRLDKMELIDLPDGGKAWVCHAIQWAIFPERSQAGAETAGEPETPFDMNMLNSDSLATVEALLELIGEKTYVFAGSTERGAVFENQGGYKVIVMPDGRWRCLHPTGESFDGAGLCGLEKTIASTLWTM